MKINDIFWTFQGEGYNSGTRALFIRMPYCNLKCSWCDTEFNSFKEVSADELIAIAKSEKSTFAVITGGEPSMNKDTPKVIGVLKDLGFYIAMESNGTFMIPDGVDWLTVSPKRDAKYEITYDALNKASEFKFVIDKDFDMNFLKSLKFDHTKKLYLSPEFTDIKENLEKMYSFIAENPKWKISLQTHKWMGIK